MSQLTAQARAAIAAKAGVSDAYLYQCLTGRRSMSPADAVRVESESGGAVRRWDLRPDDWHRIWPELMGLDGAPPTPQKEAV